MSESVVCEVCPRSCTLEDGGQAGFCGTRKNRNGENIDSTYSLFYPYPEENKFAPPGTYTICFAGCNLRCWFCEVPFLSSCFNGDVSGYRKLSPIEVVEKVKESGSPEDRLLGLFGGEPAIHPEFILEVGRLCREAGYHSGIYTNGYVSETVFRDILNVVDVVSIDLKGNYQHMGIDDIGIILRNIEQSWKTSSVTTVVREIVGPGLLPSVDDISNVSRFLCEHVSPNVSVVMEGLVQPMDYFPNQIVGVYAPLPGEEDGYMRYARCRWVGLHMLNNGLEYVEFQDLKAPNPHRFLIPPVDLPPSPPTIPDKPKSPSILNMRVIMRDFMQRHTNLDDPYWRLFHLRDLEVAAAYNITPEDVLALDPRVYERWGA
jgi:pyruvate-formate lyase-activating enzyme